MALSALASAVPSLLVAAGWRAVGRDDLDGADDVGVELVEVFGGIQYSRMDWPPTWWTS